MWPMDVPKKFSPATPVSEPPRDKSDEMAEQARKAFEALTPEQMEEARQEIAAAGFGEPPREQGEPARCVHGTNPPSTCEHCTRASRPSVAEGTPDWERLLNATDMAVTDAQFDRARTVLLSAIRSLTTKYEQSRALVQATRRVGAQQFDEILRLTERAEKAERERHEAQGEFEDAAKELDFANRTVEEVTADLQAARADTDKLREVVGKLYDAAAKHLLDPDSLSGDGLHAALAEARDAR